MAYSQIRINSIDRPSGSYQLRINFDNNVKWSTTGSFINIDSQACLISMGALGSSRATEGLENALGTLSVELSDYPGLVYSGGVGNIIRECFDQARIDNYMVHAVLGRYSNAAIPVFQEFVFAGTVNPREISIAHRRVSPTGRRIETINCEFTPAKRLDFPLSGIDWQESDMEANPRPFFLCVANEPGHDGWLNRNRYMPKRVTDAVVDGIVIIDNHPYPADPGVLTADLAYGIQPFSLNKDVDKLRDQPGIGPFPMGNWAIKLSTVINKLFTACNIVWDGTFPSDLNFRYAHFDNGSKMYQDDGDMPLSLVFLNWNYVFGKNPFDNLNWFKGPGTFDDGMFCRDFLKAIAAQLKSRIDINGYNADGLPIARFVKFGQTSGTFPHLTALPDSTEDAFITDKDGVRITRRGFEGAVIAPADAKSPVEIEIPFAPYAIGYETTPCYDASRLTPNAALSFIDQWKCAFRDGINSGAADETIRPLNPDGWVTGSHLFRFDSSTAINQFPVSHNSPAFGEFEAEYRASKYQGYYPIHAIYDVDRSLLTDLERKERQQNYLISYALYFGRYIRGERGRLTMQFLGCVAPNWSDIATGQVFQFAPLTTLVDYVAVEISRDILTDVITVQFEEASPDTLPLSYRIDGDQKGNGSIGGGGKTDGGTGTPPTTDENQHLVKFYSGGVSQKEILMSIRQFYDITNKRKVALSGVPYPYDEVSPDKYGQNAEYSFHYKGSEAGNVEIVGLSPTGTADYWASAVTQYKHGSNPTDNTDVTCRRLNKRWSENRNSFIVERPLQAAAVKPRIYVAGRFELAFTGVFTWINLATATWPLSNEDCKSDIDKGYYGASAVLPTLAVVAGEIKITWASKFKPVTIMSQAWAFNATDVGGASGHDWQIGANPVRNQTAAFPNSVFIGFWLNDWAALVGARHQTVATLTTIFGQPALDLIVVDFWGELEVVGENA